MSFGFDSPEPDAEKPARLSGPFGNDAIGDKIPTAPSEPVESGDLSAATELSSPNLPPTLIPCRRCGKMVPETLQRCPFCDARLPGGRRTEAGLLTFDSPQASVGASHTAISRLLIFYLVLLLVNVLPSLILFADTKRHMREEDIDAIALPMMVFGEIADTVIVIIALFAIPRPPPIQYGSSRQRKIGWLMGPVVLAAVLALNFGYHALLENYVQFPKWSKPNHHLAIGWTFVLICVQPGIIEELFFRYIALGTLNRVMGVAGAICVSSVMFGMAHSFVALSIPILAVVGAGLGLVRVWSGSLILPMLLHMLHNTVVVYFESLQ
jgi:membrane protease YdiL (CAAX protease family)